MSRISCVLLAVLFVCPVMTRGDDPVSRATLLLESATKRLRSEAARSQPSAILSGVQAIQTTCELVDEVSADNPPALYALDRPHLLGTLMVNMSSILRTTKPKLDETMYEDVVDDMRRFTKRPVYAARELMLGDLLSGDSSRLASGRKHLLLYTKLLGSLNFQIGTIHQADRRFTSDSVALTAQWVDDTDLLPEGVKPWSSFETVLNNYTSYPWADEELVRPVYNRLDLHPNPYVSLFARRGRLGQSWKSRQADNLTKARDFAGLRDSALKIIDAERENQGSVRLRNATLHFLDSTINHMILRGGEPLAIEVMRTADALMDRKSLSSGHSRMIVDAVGKAGESTAQRAHDLLTRYTKYRTAELRNGDAGTDHTLTRIRAAKFRLENRFPHLATTPRVSPVSVRELYHAAGQSTSQSMITYPLVRKDVVYAVIIEPDRGGTLIHLVGVPFAGGTMRSLGAVRSSKRYRYQYQFYENYVTATCGGPDSYFVAVRDQGVFQFSLHRPEVKLVASSTLTPTGPVESLALSDDSTLYMGVEGGLIYSVQVTDQPATQIDPVIVVDRDMDKPASDTRDPYHVPHLLVDANRKRLLIVIQNRREQGDGLKQYLELWERRSDGSLKRMHLLGRPQRRRTHARLDGDTLTMTDVWFARWNFQTGKTHILSNYSLGDLKPTRKVWIPYWSEATLCQGSVWWLRKDGTLGQYEFPNGKPEFHTIAGLNGKPFDSGDECYLTPVNDSSFLVYYGQRLWLATLNEE